MGNKINMRLPDEPKEKICVKCGKTLPIENFGLYSKKRKGESRYYRQSYCYECRKAKWREITNNNSKQRELRYLEREGKTCRDNCEFYPCFRGIDNIITNMALTCVRFKDR